MAFFSGKDGRASFASTAYKITAWTAESVNDIQDVTNGESGGEGESVAGVTDVEWEVEMDYYTGNSPFASGKLRPGQIGTLLLYHTNGGSGWTIQADVKSAREELQVRGRVRVYAKGVGTVVSGVTTALAFGSWEPPGYTDSGS